VNHVEVVPDTSALAVVPKPGTPLTATEIARYAKTGCRHCDSAGVVRVIPGERRVIEQNGRHYMAEGIPSKHVTVQHNDPDGPGTPARATYTPAWREDQKRTFMCKCVRKNAAKDVLAGKLVLDAHGVVCWPAGGES
jgi:hypothetical protein